MGWKHLKNSLLAMMNLVKVFVAILVPGCGYQSTGVLANWDVPNLRKALRWAELFEKGLAHFSSTTMSTARRLVVEQLIRGLPLRSEQLRSVVVATVEPDLYGLSNVEDGSLKQYLNKLTPQITSLESVLLATGSSEFSWDSYSGRVANMNENPVVGGFTGIYIQLLLKRQSSALRAWDLASGLNAISGAVTSSNLTECDETFLQDKLWAATTPMNEGASDMFSELGNSLPGRHERFGDMAPLVVCMRSVIRMHPQGWEGNTLMEYLTKLLDGRLSLLWKLHPILPSVAMPSSSLLFKVYLGQIESLWRDDSPTSRLCISSQKKEEPIDCELAERIWCLHTSMFMALTYGTTAVMTEA